MKPRQIAFGILALVITVHIGSIDWHPLMAIPFGVLVGYINFRAILKGKVGKVWHYTAFLILLSILLGLILLKVVALNEAVLVTALYNISFVLSLNTFRKLPLDYVGRSGFWDSFLWRLVEKKEPTRWKWVNKFSAKRIYGREWFPSQTAFVLKLLFLVIGWIIFLIDKPL